MATPRTGACPACRKPSLLEASNDFRPFCSERCKLLDLDDWMSGRFAIPVVEADGEADGAQDPERLQ